MRFPIFMAAALAAAGYACAAAPVGDALQRPALSVKAPQRSVLLSAAEAASAPDAGFSANLPRYSILAASRIALTSF